MLTNAIVIVVLGLLFPVGLAKTFDLESVSEFQEVIEVRFLNLHFTPVHEQEQVADYFFSGIFENDDGMLFRQIFEQPNV